MDAPPFLFGLFQPAIRLIPYSLFIGKLYAHGFAELYIVVCVSEFSGLLPDFVTQKCPFCNWLINNILYLCIPLFWGTQKVF